MDATEYLKISAIIAVYNNEEYAKDLYRSLDAQTLDSDYFEIILVNDGSTDGTLQLALEWQKRTKLKVKVLDKPNGGVSSARNYGISHAEGTWLAFIDSDDILHKSYLSMLVEFMRRDRFDSASMLTTRSIIYNEDDGITVDNHPLSWKYKRGDRLVSLEMEPHVVHLAGHSSVVRRAVVLEHGIRFNEDVRPGFEDANFNGRYLSHFAEPIVGLVASARYFYRKRANGSSLIDTTWTRPEKFSHEPRYGHLGLLQEVTSRLGYTPVWAQNTVLYAQYWYFSADRSWNSPMASVDQELLDEYWMTLHEVFEYIDAETIRTFALRNFGWYMSEGLLRHFKGQAWSSSDEYVAYRWGEADPRRHVRKYVYSYADSQPFEQFYHNDKEIEPVYAKSIKQSIFGNHLMYERIVYLPSRGRVAICLNRTKIPIVALPKMNRVPSFKSPMPDYLQLDEGEVVASPQQMASLYHRDTSGFVVRQWKGLKAVYSKAAEEAWVNGIFVGIALVRIVRRVFHRKLGLYEKQRSRRRDHNEVSRALAATGAEVYENCWILLDRTDRADDNAEHLYRHIQSYNPEINAWFMLSRDSKDWDRLKAEGFRLIPFGETEAMTAVLKAKFILSSHVDGGSYLPIDEKRFGPIRAKRIFLQHGMTKDDLSKWLNTKNIALMATCSIPERESIIGDGTPYRLTKREVKLTGFPRHDALVSNARQQVAANRRVVLIVPTWRKDLSDSLNAASKSERREILLTSEFFREWEKVTNSTVFLNAVRKANLKIVFALHDHLSDFSELFEFNEHVHVESFGTMSVQRMLLDSKLIITDYSSMSTEAAIAGAAVIHYQFDADRIFDGSHSYRKGWMDYDLDAFGPVCINLNDFESEIVALETDNWSPNRLYSDRLSRLLPMLDGSACSRLVNEVLALDSIEVRVD